MKWILLFPLLVVLTLDALIIETEGRPSPSKAPVTLNQNSGSGTMVDSNRCNGVKCYTPPAESKCTASSTNSTGGAVEACCPIYTCGSLQQGQSSYSALSGEFPGGPPVGFGLPGPANPNYQYRQQDARMFQASPGKFSNSESKSYSYSSHFQSNSG